MFLLKCGIQNYPWGKIGSNSLIATYKMDNDPTFIVDNSLPYAEYWFGTHQNKQSTIITDEGEMKLSYFFERYRDAGGMCNFPIPGQLPFLYKVLSIGQPLSIQAHPNKELAVKLHEINPKEYPDNNHKPEMAIALTEFTAMCGFRNLNEIANYLSTIPELKILIDEEIRNQYISGPSKEKLKDLFSQLINSESTKIVSSINSFKERMAGNTNNSFIDEIVQLLISHYPNDYAVFCPYFFNVLKLNPDESIYIGAGIPHSYISGDILEVMANSDNVVRAGLTGKFVDKDTLVNMLTYESSDNPKVIPKVVTPEMTTYEGEADEFAIDKVVTKGSYTLKQLPYPRIFVVTEGEGVGEFLGNERSLKPGSTFLVSAYWDIQFTGNLTMYGARPRK